MKTPIKSLLLLISMGAPLAAQPWSLSTLNKTFSQQIRSSAQWLKNPTNKKNIIIGSTIIVAISALLYNKGFILHKIYNLTHKNFDYSFDKCLMCNANARYVCPTYNSAYFFNLHIFCERCFKSGLLSRFDLCPICFTKCGSTDPYLGLKQPTEREMINNGWN